MLEQVQEPTLVAENGGLDVSYGGDKKERMKQLWHRTLVVDAKNTLTDKAAMRAARFLVCEFSQLKEAMPESKLGFDLQDKSNCYFWERVIENIPISSQRYEFVLYGIMMASFLKDRFISWDAKTAQGKSILRVISEKAGVNRFSYGLNADLFYSRENLLLVDSSERTETFCTLMKSGYIREAVQLLNFNLVDVNDVRVRGYVKDCPDILEVTNALMTSGYNIKSSVWFKLISLQASLPKGDVTIKGIIDYLTGDDIAGAKRLLNELAANYSVSTVINFFKRNSFITKLAFKNSPLLRDIQKHPLWRELLNEHFVANADMTKCPKDIIEASKRHVATKEHQDFLVFMKQFAKKSDAASSADSKADRKQTAAEDSTTFLARQGLVVCSGGSTVELDENGHLKLKPDSSARDFGWEVEDVLFCDDDEDLSAYSARAKRR